MDIDRIPYRDAELYQLRSRELIFAVFPITGGLSRTEYRPLPVDHGLRRILAMRCSIISWQTVTGMPLLSKMAKKG
jgi:hypothetical protein